MPNEKPEPLAEALRKFLDQQGLAKRVGQQTALEAWPLGSAILATAGLGAVPFLLLPILRRPAAV